MRFRTGHLKEEREPILGSISFLARVVNDCPSAAFFTRDALGLTPGPAMKKKEDRSRTSVDTPRPGAKSLSPSLSWPQPGLVHDS